MEKLGNTQLWSFLSDSSKIQQVSNHKVRIDSGLKVVNYLELAAKIAELQFRNRDHVLIFRGQSADYKTTRLRTALKPSIFRPPLGRTVVSKSECAKRYDRLELAEKLLAQGFEKLNRLGKVKVHRQRLLRWAILQHYEVCATPLLDVTHSLRIAASFATEGARAEAYVFVLAVPNLSGAVTASAEAGLQIVRLASVCPPSAIRAHIQEGYLLGEYPDMTGPSQQLHYKYFEMDFGLRLIGKFRLNSDHFWQPPTFPRVPREALYPQSKDWLEHLTAQIKAQVAAI
jgi:hypothetical protein